MIMVLSGSMVMEGGQKGLRLIHKLQNHLSILSTHRIRHLLESLQPFYQRDLRLQMGQLLANACTRTTAESNKTKRV